MKKKILTVLLATAVALVASSSYASGNKDVITAKGYTVHSVIDGRESTIAFDEKGKWVYTIQYYSANNLDKNIMDKVKTIYDDYVVTGIQKIEQPDSDAVYMVNLENKTSIKIVRVADNKVELVKDLIKE